MQRMQRIVEVVCGLCFLLGAISFVAMVPEHTAAEVRSLSGAGDLRLVAAIAALVAGCETWLGLSLLVRPGAKVRYVAIAVLVAFSVALLVRGFSSGWALRCRCFGAFFEQGLVAAVLRNVVLLAGLVFLVVRRKNRVATVS